MLPFLFQQRGQMYKDLNAPGGSPKLCDGNGLSEFSKAIYSAGLCTCHDKKCQCDVRGVQQQDKLARNIDSLPDADQKTVMLSVWNREGREEAFNLAEGAPTPTPSREERNSSIMLGILPLDSTALSLLQLTKTCPKTTVTYEYVVNMWDHDANQKVPVLIIATYNILDMSVGIKAIAQDCGSPGRPLDYDACEKLICAGIDHHRQKEEVAGAVFMGLGLFWEIVQGRSRGRYRLWKQQIVFFKGDFLCNFVRQLHADNLWLGNLPTDFGGNPKSVTPNANATYAADLFSPLPECDGMVLVTYRRIRK